jgi:hypothetical protein
MAQAHSLSTRFLNTKAPLKSLSGVFNTFHTAYYYDYYYYLYIKYIKTYTEKR